jgi:hypothetical protein
MLREAWGPDEQPAPAAQRRARVALLDRIQGAAAPTADSVHNGTQPRSRRRGWTRGWPARVGLTAAAVALAVVGGVTVENLGQVDGRGRGEPVVAALPFARPANAAEVLENAATLAARRPDAVARPDQWVYQETRTTTTVKAGGAATGGPYETITQRSWHRIDGQQTAYVDEAGQLVVKRQGDDQTYWVGHSYAELAKLTTPEAVLDWLESIRKAAPPERERDTSPDGRDANAFSMLSAVLRYNVLPAAVEAAVYRAIGQLGGTHVNLNAVNVDGRPAIGLGRVTEGWLAEEIMLDPQTYRFIGERSIAVADHRLDRNLFVPKGTLQIELIRVAAAIVDKPGDTQ